MVLAKFSTFCNMALLITPVPSLDRSCAFLIVAINISMCASQWIGIMYVCSRASLLWWLGIRLEISRLWTAVLPETQSQLDDLGPGMIFQLQETGIGKPLLKTFPRKLQGRIQAELDKQMNGRKKSMFRFYLVWDCLRLLHILHFMPPGGLQNVVCMTVITEY